MNLPSVYALDKYGLRTGVFLGIILTTLGLWVRCLINQSFLTVIVGQTICAIANPLLFNAPTKVTSSWFSDAERPYATMIGTSANVFGVSLGFLLPSLFIDKYEAELVYTESEIIGFK